jgi:hypothetical protein
MSNSKYLCARCGLPVREWGNGWKHSGGAFAHSCGKIPKLMLRTDYEKQIDETLKSAHRFIHTRRPEEPNLERFNNRNSSFTKKGEDNG